MTSPETEASECGETIRRLSFLRAKLMKELASVETSIRAETAKLDILMAPALEALERDLTVETAEA